MTVLKYLLAHKAELLFLFVFVLFLVFVHFLDFRSSLVESFKEGMEDEGEANYVVQIGKNSSTINSLREKLNKINPDKIENMFNDMKNDIEKNTSNIELIRQAQDKIDEDTNENNDE